MKVVWSFPTRIVFGEGTVGETGSEAKRLGGSQALSRSLFSQMIPKNRESEYFSLYEISERGTSWLGPVVFALALQFTGAQRVAILLLIAFFILGLIMLYFTDVEKAIREAGNEVPAVV